MTFTFIALHALNKMELTVVISEDFVDGLYACMANNFLKFLSYLLEGI